MFGSFLKLFVFWLYTHIWLDLSQPNQDLKEEVMRALSPRAQKISDLWAEHKKYMKASGGKSTKDTRQTFIQANTQQCRLFVAQRAATRLGVLPTTNDNGGKWRWKHFLSTAAQVKGGVR